MLNSDNIEIVVKKLTVHGTKVRLLGFLKSVFFQENTSTAYQYVKPHAANISSQTAFDSHIGYILFQEMEIHYYFQ